MTAAVALKKSDHVPENPFFDGILRRGCLAAIQGVPVENREEAWEDVFLRETNAMLKMLEYLSKAGFIAPALAVSLGRDAFALEQELRERARMEESKDQRLDILLFKLNGLDLRGSTDHAR